MYFLIIFLIFVKMAIMLNYLPPVSVVIQHILFKLSEIFPQSVRYQYKIPVEKFLLVIVLLFIMFCCIMLISAAISILKFYDKSKKNNFFNNLFEEFPNFKLETLNILIAYIIILISSFLIFCLNTVYFFLLFKKPILMSLIIIYSINLLLFGIFIKMWEEIPIFERILDHIEILTYLFLRYLPSINCICLIIYLYNTYLISFLLECFNQYPVIITIDICFLFFIIILEYSRIRNIVNYKKLSEFSLLSLWEKIEEIFKRFSEEVIIFATICLFQSGIILYTLIFLN